MQTVVFIPGIFGSRLATPHHEEVWPPTPLEVTLGYTRTQKLLRDDLIVTDIVRAVSCFDFYAPLIDIFAAMGFREDGQGDRLNVFAYDWRRDLEMLADELSAQLDAVPPSTQSITLVAHSMGGLIARLLLEAGRYEDRPWFKKIKVFMALATPHLGAPLALGRILGLDTAMGVSAADFRKLASDPRYPSGYQLLPAPGELACWDIRAEGALTALDIYDADVATNLGLDPALVARAAWVHKSLADGAPPTHVRYFYFAATGHKTATRLNIGGGSKLLTTTQDAGDGTVPLWSAVPNPGQKQLVIGEHTDFFRETTFKAVFFALFGKPFATPPVGVAQTAEARISIQSMSIHKKQEIELLIVPERSVDVIEGQILLEITEGPNVAFQQTGNAYDILYRGPEIPKLTVILPPAEKPGFYQARFAGEPRVKAPARFMVTDQ